MLFLKKSNKIFFIFIIFLNSNLYLKLNKYKKYKNISFDFFPKNEFELINFEKDFKYYLDINLKQIFKLYNLKNSNKSKNKKILEILNNLLSEYFFINNLLYFLNTYSIELIFKLKVNATLKNIKKLFNKKIIKNNSLYNIIQNIECKNTKKKFNNTALFNFINQLENYFKQNGSNLSAKNKKKLKTITKQYTDCYADFLKNCEPSNDNDNAQRFDTLNNILENSTDNYIRKNSFKDFYSKKNYKDNSTNLKKIINLSNKKAELFGAKNFIELSLKNQSFKHSKEVFSFLDKIILQLQKYDSKIFQKLKKLNLNSIFLKNNKFEMHDELFVKKNFYNQILSINENLLAEYFELNQILSKILQIFEKLFDIKIVKSTINNNNYHSKDLLIYSVYRKKKFLGHIICDFYSNSTKQEVACCFNVIKNVKNFKHAPIVLLSTNFEKNSENFIFLKLYDLKILLHEFGHAFAEILSKNDYIDLSAESNLNSDLIEFHSQLFEYFLCNKSILEILNQHYKTNEKLSPELIENIIKVEKIFKYCADLKQAFLAKLILIFYNTNKNSNFHKITENLYTKTFKFINYNAENYFEFFLSHLYNYGALYYGYVFTNNIARNLFKKINNYGIFNKKSKNLLKKAFENHKNFIEKNKDLKLLLI